MNGEDGGSRKSVRVEIAGEEYTIRTEADEEYTRRCAALVDERMRTIGEAVSGEGSGGTAHKRVAIMAALSISDDLLQYKDQARVRAQELAKRVEEALEDVPPATPAVPENDAPPED